MEKLIVKETCIGCGICVGENPDYFMFNDDGMSVPAKKEVLPEDKVRILETIEKCPVDAILIEEEVIAEEPKLPGEQTIIKPKETEFKEAA